MERNLVWPQDCVSGTTREYQVFHFVPGFKMPPSSVWPVAKRPTRLTSRLCRRCSGIDFERNRRNQCRNLLISLLHTQRQTYSTIVPRVPLTVFRMFPATYAAFQLILWQECNFSCKSLALSFPPSHTSCLFCSSEIGAPSRETMFTWGQNILQALKMRGEWLA